MTRQYNYYIQDNGIPVMEWFGNGKRNARIDIDAVRKSKPLYPIKHALSLPIFWLYKVLQSVLVKNGYVLHGNLHAQTQQYRPSEESPKIQN